MHDENSFRRNRKIEHIRCFLALEDGPFASGLEDLNLIHQALPELNFEEIDLSVEFMGKRLDAPIIINAITGGNQEVLSINRALAQVAREFNLAMAVGSQTAALENPAVRETYQVARQENPAGGLLANIGALIAPEQALRAVEMIQADALQVHLNVPQELAMDEGDRTFAGVLANLSRIVEACPVPVMVKEVGFGLSRETVTRLAETGVQWVDIGGLGGTNFIAIENQRGESLVSDSLETWGIPTAISLLETLAQNHSFKVVATGGIRSALDVAKVLAVGADLAGMAGPILRLLIQESPAALRMALTKMLYELRCIFLMTGAKNLQDLQRKPVVITGKTREWLAQRGIETAHYAQR